MSMQALQEFIGRHMISTGALTALCAVLDEKATGTTTDPVLGARIQELLAAIGAGDLVKDIGPQEAATIRSMIRAMYLLDSKLMFAKTRGRGCA